MIFTGKSTWLMDKTFGTQAKTHKINEPACKQRYYDLLDLRINFPSPKPINMQMWMNEKQINKLTRKSTLLWSLLILLRYCWNKNKNSWRCLLSVCLSVTIQNSIKEKKNKQTRIARHLGKKQIQNQNKLIFL